MTQLAVVGETPSLITSQSSVFITHIPKRFMCAHKYTYTFVPVCIHIYMFFGMSRFLGNPSTCVHVRVYEPYVYTYAETWIYAYEYPHSSGCISQINYIYVCVHYCITYVGQHPSSLYGTFMFIHAQRYIETYLSPYLSMYSYFPLSTYICIYPNTCPYVQTTYYQLSILLQVCAPITMYARNIKRHTHISTF